MAAPFHELFRSTDEQETPVDAVVTGSLPKWLRGSLIRLGPGKFDLQDFRMNHWFDGFAVLYKIEIANGKVKFRKKFLKSDAYNKALSFGKPVFTEFGTRAYPDPSKNIFSRMLSTLLPELTDNGAINPFTLEDSLFVASETNNIRRVNPNTLETCEKVDLNKLVGVNLTCSHVQQDDTGTSYTIGTSLMSGAKYHVVKIPPVPSGKASEAFAKTSIIATIPSSWMANMSYYHSFGMSENYIVFIEQPLIINGLRLVGANATGKSLRECMDWNAQEPNKFFVIDKRNGKVVPVKYKSSEPFFIFHHINTYEDDGHLVVDVVAYDSPAVLEKLYLEKLRQSKISEEDPPGGRRFVLPLPQNKEDTMSGDLIRLKTKATAKKIGDSVMLTPEILSEPGYELPTLNKAVFGKKYQYFYAAGLYTPGAFRNAIVKVDTVRGDIKIWRENEYTYPGEMQFVPSPGASDEDDGLLLSAVTDVRQNERDFLLVLNAKTFSEIARAEINVHIPNLLHGIFLSY